MAKTQISDLNGVRLSALSPKYLHTNSTSHTWPFSAIAELIDNAYDPDVDASQLWIDVKHYKNVSGYCLIFADNGAGMNPEKLHKMLSFGFCEKVAKKGHMPVGHYGNGFKSGSMRLGKDAAVFTKDGKSKSVGFLSQTYLEAIKAETILVPIVTWDSSGKMFEKTDGDKALRDIFKYSLWRSLSELMHEFDQIDSDTGTRIVTFRTRKTSDGKPEFDYVTDMTDIRIPDDTDQESSKFKKQQRQNHIPESDYSLRAYCAILYLKPRMQIILRGKKVRTMVIAKSLSKTEVDAYKPQHMARSVKITFGFSQNKNHYGIMMYHRNRLIKPYIRVGYQLKPNNFGVGVVGVIECDFLQPTHNKQDFDYTKVYRACMSSLGIKLNEYWNEKKGPNRGNSQVIPEVPIEVQSLPDQVWVQCDKPTCLKWRKLPMGTKSEDLPDKWYCKDNPDHNFRTCDIPEEREEERKASVQPYIKIQKRRLERELGEQKRKEKEMKLIKETQQVEEARKLELKKAELQKKEEDLQRRITELQHVKKNESAIVKAIETQSTRQKTNMLQQQYKFHNMKADSSPKVQAHVSPVASTPMATPNTPVSGTAVRYGVSSVGSTPQKTTGSRVVLTSTSNSVMPAQGTPSNQQLVKIAASPPRMVQSNQQPGVKIVKVVRMPSMAPGNLSRQPLRPNLTATQKIVSLASQSPTAQPQVMPKVVSVHSLQDLGALQQKQLSVSGQPPGGLKQHLLSKVVSVGSAAQGSAPLIVPRQVAQVQALPTRINGQLVQVKMLSPATTAVGPVRIAPSTTTTPQTPQMQISQAGAGGRQMYKPLGMLQQVTQPSSTLFPTLLSAVSGSSSDMDAELGREQVTINERYRFIAPTGLAQTSPPGNGSGGGDGGLPPAQPGVQTQLVKSAAQDISQTVSAPAQFLQVQVKEEPMGLQQQGTHTVVQTSAPQQRLTPQGAPIQLSQVRSVEAPVTSVVRVKQEVMEEESGASENSTVNGFKRRLHLNSSTDQPPRQKSRLSDNDVIIIDPPSPPVDDKRPCPEAPPPPPDMEANSSDVETTEEGNEDIDIVIKLSKLDSQERVTAFITASRHLRSLRSNVCKLLRLLVPELQLDTDKKEILEDTTVDELLQQVLAANTQL